MAPWLNWSPPKWLSTTTPGTNIATNGATKVVMAFSAAPGFAPLRISAGCESFKSLFEVSNDNGKTWTMAADAYIKDADPKTETVDVIASFAASSPPPPQPSVPSLFGVHSSTAKPSMLLRYSFNETAAKSCVLVNTCSGVPLGAAQVLVVWSATATATAARSDNAGTPAGAVPRNISSSTEAGKVAATRAILASASVKPPPMGFNSWNRWHCWVDEHKLKETADQLINLKLADAGYDYLNIDGQYNAVHCTALQYSTMQSTEYTMMHWCAQIGGARLIRT